MIDILERDGDRVLWRHNNHIDGCSWIQDGQLSTVEVYDADFSLTEHGRGRIAMAVKDWLDETGEGEKWLEENS